VGYSSDKLLCATTKESGDAVKEGMLACARCKSHIILSSSTMYMITITYPCFIPVMSQKFVLFEAQCPFGAAGEWSHRDGPPSMGAPLGDHCVPMNDVQGGLFLYSCIVDLI
jgi:hypothetical protein